MERCGKPVKFGPDPKKIQWDLVPFGDPEWIYALNRHTCFLNLAKAWLFTNDDQYIIRLIQLTEDWIDRNPLCPDAENDVWRSLEAGLRCEFWLRTLQLTADSPFMTENLKRKIEDSLKIHGAYLVRKSGDFHKLSNWGVLQDHGLFLLGVWFERQDWIQLAVQRLTHELHIQVMNDGSHWEHSPMYHCEVLHCALDTVLIARQNQIDLPCQLKEAARRMCHAVLGMVTPDGTLIRQGDSDAIDARDEMAAGAILFGDHQLRKIAGPVPFPENLWDMGPDAWSLHSIPEGDIDPAFSLPDSGNYIFRTRSASDTPYLHFYCGTIGGGHGHADQLHIEAGVGEEAVLIDSGRYTYTDTDIRMELKSPKAHNTTTVDDVDFSVGLDTWSWNPIAVPVKGEFKDTPNAAFVSGHHLGYLHLGIFVTREILWLRHWNTAIIFDQFFQFNQNTSHKYRQYFHFAPGEIHLKDNRLHWKGKKAQADLICLGDVTCELSKAPCAEFYNELSQCDLLTVSQTQTGFSSFLSVLDLSAETPLTVQSLPVSCVAGALENDPCVKSLKLTRNKEQAVIMLRCRDAAPPSALLKSNGCEGYGRVIVFDSDAPDGLCLSW